MNIWLYAAGIVLCILLSAFFSGSETAFSAAGDTRLKLLSEKGGAARTAYSVYLDFDRVLIAVLVGNNLVNITASSLATLIAVALMGDKGAWVATSVMTVLIITFGEILPKLTAGSDPERTCVKTAVPLRAWAALLRPLVFLASRILDGVSKLWETKADEDAVTEDDLETILETVEDEGVVDEDTADLLQSALSFDDVQAYEIITPRVDMVALDTEDSREKNLGILLASPYTRLPVYTGTPDNIIGILHLNMVLKALAQDKEADLFKDLMEPLFVHKTMPLDDVLTLMRDKKLHLAVVTDEYGGTMGILTMEDVLEQLVGEIWDESDVIEEELVRTGEHTWEVDGDMRLGDFFEAFGYDEEDIDDDNATVGGWATEMLGGYAKKRESFVFEALRITVLQVVKRRILRLEVEQDADVTNDPGKTE